jgi:hypothetical protein
MTGETLVGLYSINAFDQIFLNTGASVEMSFTLQDAMPSCQYPTTQDNVNTVNTPWSPHVKTSYH